MPQIWMKDISKVAVRLDELIPNWFPTYWALRMKIDRNKNDSYGIKRLQRGCKGSEILIDFDTLDREIQLALGDPRKVTHIMERWYEEDGTARRFYSDFEFENGEHLKPDHIEEYTINASVLNAVHLYKIQHQEERAKRGKKATKLYEFMVNEAQAFQEVLKVKFNYQHTLPKSERQFRDVYDRYFTEEGKSYRDLISGKLQNDNARLVTDKVTQLLDSMFAGVRTKPNKKKVHTRYQMFMEGLADVVNNATGEVYNPADFKPLSERSVTKWLNSWTSRIGTYTKRGADRQKLMDQFSIPHEMDLPKFAGSLYSVDDRQPPFEYAPSERLWVYNGLDVASRAITATVWGKSKEGMILEFYRQIVRNYTQWGIKLPYELEAEVSLNNSYKDTLLKNGVMFNKVRLIPNRARAKYIERINKELRHDLEKEYDLWKGRPHARDESSQPMNYDGLYSSEKYRAYESLVQQTLQVVSDWNNMPHPEKKEMTKWQYFLQHQHPQLTEPNWKAFMPYLGHSTPSSCNLGKIRLQGANYFIGDKGAILYGESLINKMERIEGEKVQVYWLDGNDGNVLKALAYVDGEYICELIPVPKWQRSELERTDQDLINQQIQARYVATVEAFRKERTRSIEEVTIIEHQTRTLNDDFVMPGLNKYIERTDTGSTLEDEDEDNTPYVPNTNYTKRSLLNSYQ